MALKFQGLVDKGKLARNKRDESVLSAFSGQAAETLKRARKEKIKEEVMPERKRRIEKLGIAPEKKFKLYGDVVIVKKIDDDSLVKVFGRGGRYSPKFFEPTES